MIGSLRPELAWRAVGAVPDAATAATRAAARMSGDAFANARRGAR
jgi:hypothetical protein